MSRLSRFSMKAATALCGSLLVLTPFVVAAPVARAQTTADTQAQISALQGIIAQLMAQIAALSGQSKAPSQITCGIFVRDLTTGSTGEDVTCLQNLLISKGYTIAPGATGRFDAETKNALALWQKANNIAPATGFFGPESRAMLNASVTQTSTTSVQSKEKLTLTAPNNGEKWQIGDTHTILWTPYDMSNSSAQVNPASDMTAYLERLTSGGAFDIQKKFKSLGKLMDCGKASIHTDLALEECGTGKYAEPGEYYIRIVNNKTGESDRTDKPVTFVARGTLKADVKVNGSDSPITVPAKGGTYKVSWTSGGESCRIFAQSSRSEYSAIENLPASGSKNIKLFPDLGGTGQVSIYCTSSKGIEGSAYDYVEVAAVGEPQGSIAILSPNGGEALNPANSTVVSWNSTTPISKVSIALYKDDATYKWIVKDLPLGKDSYRIDSSFLSSIPAGDNYKIYIIGYKTTGGTVEDKSDTAFSIGSVATPGVSTRTTSFEVNGFAADKGEGSAGFNEPVTLRWKTSSPAKIDLDFICQDDQNVQFIRKTDGRTIGCAKGGIASYEKQTSGSIVLTPVHSKEAQDTRVTFRITIWSDKGATDQVITRTVAIGIPEKAPSGNSSSGLDVAKGTENQSHARAIFADWQNNAGAYSEATPMPLSSGQPVHTVLRLVRKCSDHSIVSKTAIRIQDGGYSNYTGSSRYQEQCVDDGTFDQYYDEAKVDGGSGELSARGTTTQMAGALEALKAALGALSGKLR